MQELADITAFVADETGLDRSWLTPERDIFGRGGISGDDCDELLRSLSERYQIDMSKHLWYFHHAEEASFNLGGLFFKPPNARVTHIPVTPTLLLEAATSGHWPVTYPHHRLPKRRYDMWLNAIIACAIIVAIAIAYFS